MDDLHAYQFVFLLLQVAILAIVAFLFRWRRSISTARFFECGLLGSMIGFTVGLITLVIGGETYNNYPLFRNLVDNFPGNLAENFLILTPAVSAVAGCIVAFIYALVSQTRKTKD